MCIYIYMMGITWTILYRMMAAPRWSRAFYLGAGGSTILVANHITIWGNPNYIINQASFIRGLTS